MKDRTPENSNTVSDEIERILSDLLVHREDDEELDLFIEALTAGEICVAQGFDESVSYQSETGHLTFFIGSGE